MEPDTRSNEDLVHIISITEPSMVEARKSALPEELSKNVVFLTCDSSVAGGYCDVYLIGTTHLSQESCRDVRDIIRFLKPEVVFLELCSTRVSLLQPFTSNPEVPTMAEMIRMWKDNHNAFDVAFEYLQAKIANEVDVVPGADFRAANVEARRQKSEVILGDRPAEITLQRGWATMSLWYKVKFLLTMTFQSLFFPNAEELKKTFKEIDNEDALTLLVQGLGKDFPSLMDTLLHERDQYMSSTLLEVAEKKSLVVAVVGKGHLQGIKNNWKQPINMDKLIEIPTNQSVFTVKRIVISLATISILAFWWKS